MTQQPDTAAARRLAAEGQNYIIYSLDKTWGINVNANDLIGKLTREVRQLADRVDTLERNIQSIDAHLARQIEDR